MGDCCILCRMSGVTWSAGLRIVSDASGSFFAAGCSTKELSKAPGLLLVLDAVVTGVPALGSGMVCFMSLELGALVLSLRLFFEKNFAVILVEG